MQIKKVAIVGAGGNVGRPLTKKLLEDGSFDVTAVVRPTSEYNPPKGVRAVTADFSDHGALASALEDQDAVMCCVPSKQVQLDKQKILIDAAVTAGVKLYFASEYAADIESKMFKLQPTELVGQKVEVRAYLEQLAATGKISWTALNPGGFFDMWLKVPFAGFEIPKRSVKIFDSGNVTLCWTLVATVVEAAVNMLHNPEPVLNRAIFVAGVADLSQNKILAALETETGVKWSVEHAETGPLFEAAKEDIKNGKQMQAVLGLAVNSMYSDERSVSNVWDRVENDVVGIKPVSVQEAVRATLAAIETA